MICPGCNGKRWVDSQHRGPTKCPVCEGDGSIQDHVVSEVSKNRYNQSAIWTEIIKGAPVRFAEKLDEEIKNITMSPVPKIIVHLLTDNILTPHGNLIYEQLRMATISGHAPIERLSNDQIISRGYVLGDDGKVKTVDDIPVGKFYFDLRSWGIDEYKENGMSEPITVDVNRKGSPLFMDNNMIAFMALFEGTEKIKSSMSSLYSLMYGNGITITNVKLVACKC
jgi:hypothetical protein